jgi:ABC-2 type transport system permease protein
MCRAIQVSKRELISYFQTPVAYVFAIVFLIASGALTFYLSNYFERGIADLQPFFMWLPWLFLFVVPAISMRLWAEEQRIGTIEFLATLPVRWWDLVVGKFLASWLFLTLTILCTTPIWITANYLGNPDNGVIFTSYLASILMAGAYLAIGSAASAFTRNQIIAFILGLSICLVFVMSGYPLVLKFLNGWIADFIINIISSMSFLSNFEEITSGVVELQNIIFFLSSIVFWLFITKIALAYKIGGEI